MYCGACEVHRGFKDAGKLRMDVAQRHKCMPGDVRCSGCRTVHIIGWARDEDYGRNCAILACLKSRNLETCGDCEKLSNCDRWRGLAKQYLAMGVDLRGNLRAMQLQGADGWVQAQAERWVCQQCSKPVAVSAEEPRCHHCGNFQL